MDPYGNWSNDPNTNFARQSLGIEQGAAASAGDMSRAQGSQRAALGMYQDAAMGQGPSQAQALMQSQGDQNMAQQMQMAAMQRGGNLGGQARSAVAGGLAAQNQTQNNLGAMAAQEQQAGMAGYAGMGTQMAGQAQQQQAMLQQQQMALMGMHTQNDQFGRQLELDRDKYKTQRNQGWATFGSGVAGSALQAGGLGA
jgi:hypothetical protein